jgi:hypothetical protein
MSEEDLNDLEYQFRVVYTFHNASKEKAHIEFVSCAGMNHHQLAARRCRSDVS